MKDGWPAGVRGRKFPLILFVHISVNIGGAIIHAALVTGTLPTIGRHVDKIGYRRSN